MGTQPVNRQGGQQCDRAKTMQCKLSTTVEIQKEVIGNMQEGYVHKSHDRIEIEKASSIIEISKEANV
jgi:hypothetical protein